MPRRSTSPSAPPVASFEAEVRANILTQPLGHGPERGTVADLDLPHEFLTRLGDRVLRATFYERFRAVVGNTAAMIPTPRPATTDAPPTLASFRADDPASEATESLDGPDAAMGTAQAMARRHLSRDGLLATTVRVIASLGAPRVVAAESPARLLASAGAPSDLLAFVRPAGVAESTPPDEIIRVFARRLAGGEAIERVLSSMRRPVFRARPSMPGFRPTSDSGRDALTMIRMHATRGTYYAGIGDGGNLDLLAGVLAAIPDVPATVVVSPQHADELRTATASIARSAPLSIITQPELVSQWAADNAKPGMLHGEPAHLMPRFASRGEYHAAFVPGDDRAANVPGVHSARSPLLFQGGNLLVVDDLPRRRRVLLVGEAEIERNRALGLSAAQTLEFFKSEFAADLCEKLPAASYHIDQEVTIRSMPEATHAFVPDVRAAAELVVQACLNALGKSGRWPGERIIAAQEQLRAQRIDDALTQIWSCLQSERTPELGFPAALAEVFSTGPGDSGVGNLHRFLLALDHLAATVISSSRCPDANLAALLRSFERRAADRAKVRTALQRLGWNVHLVPAMPEEARGISPLNGVHVPAAYLMPGYGGLLTPVDAAAAAAFRDSLGAGVDIRVIPSGESQRRHGAVHCSLAPYGQ